ncbi:type II toxin-antitoxin system VapC family toxin [Synechococcus sp. AH-601-N23]|nr:type II toxin-antitoxin system VapC family toxin [Synechococcus sp. AH-601-N23]MDA7434471.1 type II toxin-antitoxin system VapC family toxin [Synechococcus sp. AH-601-L23]
MSRVLLDTHLLLWWLNDDPRLPASLVTELQTKRHDALISQASLWEMAIKVNLGRLSVDLSALEREVPAQHFQWLPISNEHLLEVAWLETIEGHRDPFDRLLVAQSRVEPLLLFTCDRALQAYGSCVRLIT